MFALNSNLQTFYYCKMTGYTESVDSNGFRTGELVKTYSLPVKTQGNVSVPEGIRGISATTRGAVRSEPFGLITDYIRNIVVDDMDCPIDENTRVWLDIEPVVTTVDGVTTVTPEPNYEVSRVARSLNNITYSVKEVLRT